MKKTILILAALAFIFASCSNSAGGGSDSNNYVSNGTGGGNSGGEEQQQGGGNGGGSQSEPTVTGVDFFLEDYKYSLNVGQTVRIASQMQSYTTPRAIIKVETNDSSIVSVSGNQSQGFFMTGVSSGKTNVKAFESENEHDYLICEVTVIGSSSGSQSSLESFLTGSWAHSDTTYKSSGTLVLNANKTGHITTYLNGGLLHNKDLTWRAYEARDAHNQPVKVLEISGTNEGALDNAHIITTAANSFTLNGNFAFGMSNRTVWTKQ